MGSGGGRSSGSWSGAGSGRRRTIERHARRTMASRRIRRWVRIVPFEGGMRTKWIGSRAKMRRGVDKEKKGLGRVPHREGGLEFDLLLLTWPGPWGPKTRRQADNCGKRTQKYIIGDYLRVSISYFCNSFAIIISVSVAVYLSLVEQLLVSVSSYRSIISLCRGTSSNLELDIIQHRLNSNLRT